MLTWKSESHLRNRGEFYGIEGLVGEGRRGGGKDGEGGRQGEREEREG